MADEQSGPQPGASDPRGGPADDSGQSAFGQSRYQLEPDETPTLPRIFAQGDPPPGFWEQPAPQQRPEPAEEPYGVQVASSLPPRADRRKGALIGVGLVALATVLVVVLALVVGPHLGSGQADGDSDQQAAPPPTPGTASSISERSSPDSAESSSGGPTPSSTGASDTGGAVPPPDTASSDPASGSGTAASDADETTSVVTVTVTADPSATASTGSDGGSRTRVSAKDSTTPTSTTPSSTTPTTSTSATPTTSSSAPSTTRSTSPYGVPVKQISCSDGYIVQLASELTPEAFAGRVAELQRAGLVPADAKAADSRKSCQLFTNQTNTLILYAGPFSAPYEACSDRLAGPYDAFIRGANPGSSGDFVSCICPATSNDLPRLSRVGATSQWVGELQRMLAAHLNYSIPDLGIGTWGEYTPGTRAAVQRFQDDNHLRGTGVVDDRTWKALQRTGC